MKLDSRDIALTAVIASSYVIVNVIQMMSVGNPTVYGPIQLRVADCLIALSALLGWPAIVGVTFGCLLTNAYYFLGFPDVIFGPIANLIAACLIFLLRKHRFVGCVVGALPIGLIVGSYLSLVFEFPAPEALNALPVWFALILSITLSSLIAVAGIGYLLLAVLSRPSILKPLVSRGLKTVTSDDG